MRTPQYTMSQWCVYPDGVWGDPIGFTKYRWRDEEGRGRGSTRAVPSADLPVGRLAGDWGRLCCRARLGCLGASIEALPLHPPLPVPFQAQASDLRGKQRFVPGTGDAPVGLAALEASAAPQHRWYRRHRLHPQHTGGIGGGGGIASVAWASSAASAA